VRLELDDNDLGDAACAALGLWIAAATAAAVTTAATAATATEATMTPPTLLVACLAGNTRIGDTGAAALAAALAVASDKTAAGVVFSSLDFARCAIGPSGQMLRHPRPCP
jgi:hypothetical protein